MCTGTTKAWIGGLGELSFANQSSSSSANIIVGSYTGTGTKNTNPISVTLPFSPKFFAVWDWDYPDYYYGEGYGPYSTKCFPDICYVGNTSTLRPWLWNSGNDSNSGAELVIFFTVTNNTISWYSRHRYYDNNTEKTAGDFADPSYHCNKAGQIYYYVAIG